MREMRKGRMKREKRRQSQRCSCQGVTASCGREETRRRREMGQVTMRKRKRPRRRWGCNWTLRIWPTLSISGRVIEEVQKAKESSSEGGGRPAVPGHRPSLFTL